MKRTFRSAIWPLLGLLTVACAAPDGRNLPAAEDFESLSAQFAAPSKEYGSAPLFVWNKVVTPERIDEAMADLKDKGFGGVFVHPRPGMVTQYLDDNWFSLFRHTMEKGRELDMNVWIYDENSYPSGYAGGHVNEAMPESYDEGVALKYLRAGVLPDKATPSSTLRPKPFRGVAKRAITTSSTRLTTPRRRGTAASRTWI